MLETKMQPFITVSKFRVSDISVLAIVFYLFYFFTSALFSDKAFINQIHLDILEMRIGLSDMFWLKIAYWTFIFLSLFGFLFFFFKKTYSLSFYFNFFALLIYNYFFPILSEVYFEYIGIILLYLMLFKNDDDKIWKNRFWLLLSISFTFSGLAKVFSPFWTDSYTIDHLLNAWVSNKTVLGVFKDDNIKLVAQYFVLVAEIFALPFFFFSRLRRVSWFAGFALHVGAFFSLNLPQVSLCMIFVFLFFYDSLDVRRVGLGKI